MAGIYIHIPFCKRRCIYCNFFSTTSLNLRDAYVDAICSELELRSSYLNNATVETIYFGGGTPSLLSPEQISRILYVIYNIYNVHAKEITIECNPDDISTKTASTPDNPCSDFFNLGINRISIGIQTFQDRLLTLLQRRHNARQALCAVSNAQKAGFKNISIDLMFGLPGQTLADLQADLECALSLGIRHLSIYSLQYEEGTQLTRLLQKGEITESTDDLSRKMYEHIIDATAKAGFEHYEISNFALPGHQSLHNSSYWQSVPYLGIGAGAHSFNTQSRQYNCESLQAYIDGVKNKNIPVETEQLTQQEKYNEFVFTALRTRKGLNTRELAKTYGTGMKNYCLNMARKHITLGSLALDGDILTLTRKGLFISNDIMSDLMYVG